MKNFKYYLVLFLGIISLNRIMAQSEVRVTSDQNHAWGILTGTVQMDTSKFHIYYDFQMRRDDWGFHSQQLLLRGGGIFQATKATSLGLGYAYVVTSPYGDFPVKNEFLENRTWQQIQHKQGFSRSNLTHRYRLEQRHIGNADFGGFRNPRLENRARYMVKYQYVLHKGVQHPIMLNASEEVFINFGKEVTRNIFDQNRLGCSIGVGLFKGATFELGYINQYILLRGLTSDGKNKLENNHTLTASLVWNTRIKKRKGT
jgi:hypothetical protein